MNERILNLFQRRRVAEILRSTCEVVARKNIFTRATARYPDLSGFQPLTPDQRGIEFVRSLLGIQEGWSDDLEPCGCSLRLAS